MAEPGRRERSLDTLTALAQALAGEFRLQPLLERILRSAVELLLSASGSLCLVDEQSHTYHKEIDLDAGCETGRPLSLDEGMTGLWCAPAVRSSWSSTRRCRAATSTRPNPVTTAV